MVLISLLVLVLLAVKTPTVLSSADQIGVQVSFFYAAVTNVDDSIPIMTTSQFQLDLISNTTTKQRFSVGLMFPDRAAKSQTDYYTDTSYQCDIRQCWNDSAFTAFYNEKCNWNLFSYGDFPYDTFVWPLLLGSNRPISGAWMNPLQPPVSFFQNITNAWVIGYPQLIPFSNLDNSTLNKLWPSFDWQEYSMLMNSGIVHWDFIQISFKRTNAEIATLSNQLANEQLGTLAAIVAIVTPLTSVTYYGLNAYRRRKKRAREIDNRLSVWRSDLTSNENALTDPIRLMEHLEVDERPLDNFAVKYPALADSMTDLRAQMRDLNNSLAWLADFAQIRGEHRQTAGRFNGKSGRPGLSRDMRAFYDSGLRAVNVRRKNLLPKVRTLKLQLQETLKERLKGN
ncbi:MAG: hypothetical protein ACLP5V_05715 [Candidatus Bathyarchaeia archaeon]